MAAYRTLVVVGLALGLLTVLSGAQAPAVVASASRPAAVPPPEVSFQSARDYDAVAKPVRLRIPALKVSTSLEPLGLATDGTIAVPTRTDVAGWYADGPRPGQAGPAVVLGHVDSREGPGVFIDLVTLKPGALIKVDRADRTSVTFRVTGVRRVPKTKFPTDLVYAPTLDPALRLVTCGGGFDTTRRSYRDNVIVFADRA
ncbi:class F sortase [Actinoplanes sp. TBRC 11911]|uniref:class F sortase n=1 Tax=Actinoplanes sp. TBRC 11911 TaxID=2729386 RepID=UPI00145D8FA8|nr:class F sortase [Actinoplanes sp. TBRC 11911]NMO55973.1 class F sortase [Actinoplanes sp. TBRC 11911]